MTQFKRLPNFEILRVIAILMVITQHFWTYGMTSRVVSPDNPVTFINYIFFQNFLLFCKGGVPFFFLISGYFSSTKEWDVPVYKFLRIWFYAFLYGILSCILFVRHTPSLASDFKSVLKQVLPLTGNTYWFISVYLALTLFSPFFAKLAQVLNRNQYRVFLFAMVFFGMTFWFGFPFGNTIGVDNGFSLIFAAYLFMTGAYIRKYNISLPGKKGLYLLGTCAMCFLFVFITETHASGLIYVKPGKYNDLSILIAIVFFLIIKDWKVNDTWISRFIINLSPYVLGVYLIHENIYVREHLWSFVDKVFHPDLSFWTAIPYAFSIPLVIFVGCTSLSALIQWSCKKSGVEKSLSKLSESIKSHCVLIGHE